MGTVNRHRLSRRAALSRLTYLAGLASAMSLVSACSPAPQPTVPATTAPTKPASSAGAAPTSAPAAAAPTAAPKAPAALASQQALRVGIGALPKALDPNAEAGSHANAVWPILYDSLVRLDDKGDLRPGLAESWQTLDPTTWQFKLRKGVTFHNGEPFTAASAKFTLDRIADPKVSAWSGRFGLLASVEVVDDLTLTVRTKQPWPLMAKTAYVAAMLPEKYYQEKGPEGFAANPVGTGPFKFKEWRQDNFATFEANAQYWEGAPRLQSITVRAYPEPSTLVAALEAGELEIAYNLPPDDVSRLKAKNINVVSRTQGTSMVCLLRSTAGGPLASKEVRQVLNYAIDKQAIVEKLLGGQGRVLDGQIVGPEAFGYNPNVKPYPYDLNKAKALLAQAGHANGFTVTMAGVAGRFLKDKEVSETIAAQLGEIGVKVDLQILESAVWFDQYTKGISGPMILNSMAWAPLLDADQGQQIFLGNSERKLLASERFDAVYREQQTTLDPAKRQQSLLQMAEIVHDEAPVLFLFQFPGIYGVGQRVQNADFTANLAMKNLTTMSLS